MLSSLLHREPRRIQNKEELLSSILLRYAEVGSVHYWREQHALKFTFTVRQNPEIFALQHILKPALELYHSLEGQRMRLFDFVYRSEENICVFTVIRDVDSLTQREMGLIVDLIKDKCRHDLIYDALYLPEDEQIFQEEMISDMLYAIHSESPDKNVVALREEGRVLVFKS